MLNFRLFNEDCGKGLKKLESETVDLVVTSPPYDNLRTYNGFVFDFEGVARELFRTLKVGGGSSLDSIRRYSRRFRNRNKF